MCENYIDFYREKITIPATCLMRYLLYFGSLAQLVEHPAHNRNVAGSYPAGFIYKGRAL